MQVRALERGYDNVTVREPGEIFDMPDGSKAAWFEPVGRKRGQQPADTGNTDQNSDPLV